MFQLSFLSSLRNLRSSPLARLVYISISGVKVKKETREYTYGTRGTDDIIHTKFSTYERIKKIDQIKTTGDYYYEKNHLGSVVRITSSTGVVTDEYSYTVFGKAYRKNINGLYKPVAGANDSAIGNTRLFTGREYDREVSLYFNRARYYDPSLGRFTSRDPIGMRDNVNLYTYVANSPVNYVDRMGLEKVLIMVGLEKRKGEFDSVVDYYKKLYTQQGIKDSNIMTFQNIQSPSDFNSVTQSHINNINSIVWITHASDKILGLGGTIDYQNISEINLVNTAPVCTNKGNITLVSCNAGSGENPIAGALSNETGVPITAATNYVLPIRTPLESDDIGVKVGGYIVYGISRVIGYDIGEPTVPLGSWKQFNPN